MQFFIQASVGYVTNINFLVTAITIEEAMDKVKNSDKVKKYIASSGCSVSFNNVLAMSDLQTIE